MDEHDEQTCRIAAILGGDDVPVSLESLARYRDYLSRNLAMPCIMTGIDNPAWEEKYVFGYDTETEREALKKEHPSSTDIYELKRFEDLIDEGLGILVKVKRVADNRRFIIDLAVLRATDATSKNYGLLDDYSAWFSDR
jgi:hypothetical protein